jgi:serine/threonine protein kinase
LTPERWAQIEELFHRAVECDPERRATLLDENCRGDLELRQEVESLLSREAGSGNLVRAAVRSELEGFRFSLVGEVVSHYRILDGLGRGGMGLVYRAEDVNLGRQVALKFLPEESAKDPEALARFEREARAASALEHPNICPIYEFGEHQGQLFLVMQLLEGQTLRELLKNRAADHQQPHSAVSETAAKGEGALPLSQMIALADQIASGLEAAHRKGIIHRDIKPANIFVTYEGQAKILDFGLAKLAQTETEREVSFTLNPEGVRLSSRTREDLPQTTPDPFLSRTGVAMGTAGYMSPEQARGKKLDARTDLFSFGLVLYEMATGHRAFPDDTGPALHDAILKNVPAPVGQVNPGLPAKLEKIISKALEKDQAMRYQSATELRADLQILEREIGPKNLPRRWVFASAAVLVLLIGGAVFWLTRRQLTSSHALPDVKLRQLTVNSFENPVKGGVISPDGKYLAFADGKGLHIMKVGTDETQSVPAPEGLSNSDVTWEIIPTNWFPDSQRFLVNARPATETDSEWSSETASIWMVSVSGGPPQKLRDHAIAWSVSPDGSLISFGTNMGKLGAREIWLMGRSGEQAHKLYEAPGAGAICCLYFFPHAERISYVSTDESGDTLVARDLGGGPITTLLPPDEQRKLGDPAWLPDGRLIYSDLCLGGVTRSDEACNYWIMRMDTTSGKIIEKPRRLTNWVGFKVNSPSVTADGKQVAFLKSSGVDFGYVADIKAGGMRAVNGKRFTTEEAGDDTITDWTPDSQALILHSSHDGRYWIRKQRLDSDAQETLVSGMPGYDERAFVSPDGAWLIVQSVTDAGGPSRLERIPIGGGTPELILRMPGWSGSMCARAPSNLCAVAEQTSDYKQAVISSFDPVKGRGPELARFDLSPEYETTRMSLLWRISQDGTKLAFAPGPHGPIQIRSLVDESEEVLRVNRLVRPHFVWATDGKGLVMPNGSEIDYVDLKGSSKVWWKCSGECYASPSPDGRHLAINDERSTANIWMMENF